MRLLPAIVLATAALAATTPAVAQDRFAAALVYDARTNQGPCPITPQQLAAFRTSPTALDAVPRAGCRSMPFEDGTGYQVIVLNPRFGADYAVTVLSQIDLGSGVLEPRGLANVAPLNLASLGTPVAHGGRAPASVTITALTPAIILEKLLDPATMSEPLLMLTAQAADLREAYTTIKLEEAALTNELARLVGAETGPACQSVGGAPTVRGLRICVEALARGVGMDDELGIPGQPLPCGISSGAWTGTKFACFVEEVNLRIADLALIRGRMTEYNFVAAADQFDTDVAHLTTKLAQFQQNIRALKQTVDDIRELPGFDTDPLSGARQAAIRMTRRAIILKQLSSRYGDVLGERELNSLASSIADATAITSLRRRLSAMEKSVKDAASALAFNEASLTTLRKDMTQRAQGAVGEVDTLNRRFAVLFAGVNRVYLTQSDPEPRRVPIDLTEKAGANRVVFAKLTSDETFKPYQFTALVPALVAPTPGTGALVAVQPNPTLNVAPGNLPQNIDRRFTIEMHKIWRANVVAGVVFSTLRNSTFGVTTVSQGEELVLVPIVTNDQRPSPHYMLGFNYVLHPRDSFPGADIGPARFVPGLLFGIGLESAKHFFMGANFEPTLGIDLGLGLHYGEQTALQLGYTAGVTPLPEGTGSAPTRTVMARAFYVSLGFDLNLFRRFMGNVAPQ